MATEKDWITEGGAIDTLLALRGLLEGDEILFKHDAYCLHKVAPGTPLVVRRVCGKTDVAWWGDKGPLLCMAVAGARPSMGIGITRANIAGWRRP